MKQLVALIVVAGSLFAHSQNSQPSAAAQSAKPTLGEIKGIVTDPSGKPVSFATVYAVAQDLFSDALPLSAKTDRDGAFGFREGVPLGTYKLYSAKYADGYPDPLDNVYADSKMEAPKVELTESHPSATSMVRLGQKAAIVAGRIVDANTGEALTGRLAFMDGEGHGHSVPVNGSYRILVPPGKDVTMIVELGPRSERSLVPVAPLHLDPGQYVNLDIPVNR